MLALHEPSAAVTMTAVAQSVSRSTSVSFEPGVGARFAGTLIGTLLAVGLSLAVSPEFTRRRVDDLRSDPVAGFGWGLVVGVGVPFVLVLVAATGVGLLFAVPVFLVVFVHGVVGLAVGALWVGSFLVDEDDAFDRAAAGIVTLAVLAAIPVLGGLLTTLVSTCGLGVVARESYESRF